MNEETQDKLLKTTSKTGLINLIKSQRTKIQFLEPYKERYEEMKEEISRLRVLLAGDFERGEKYKAALEEIEVAKKVISETQVRATKWYELYRQAIEKNDSPL
jgi:hypothetical protein